MKKSFLHKVLCGMVCFVSVLCVGGMQRLDAKPSKQEKRLTLSLKNVPLKQALTDIERQTQYLKIKSQRPVFDIIEIMLNPFCD